MMTADPVAKFIGTVQVHFPRGAKDDDLEAAWMTSMVKFLAPYSEKVLAAAAEHILRTRDPRKQGNRWFPSPHECIEACELIKRTIDIKETPLLSYGNRDPSPWAGWRMKLADDLMQTEMGRQAAREGWNGALWNFAREHQRLPKGDDEMRTVRGAAGRFKRALADCEEGRAGAFSSTFAKLGRSIRDKHAAAARKILGAA